MISIDPTTLSIRKRHAYLTSSVYPRPIAWASTINAAGQVNLSPFSFFNCFSTNPPILVFSPSLRGKDGTKKDTLHNLEEIPEVCINVVPANLGQQMNETSKNFPADVDEFTEVGLTPVPSELIRPPRVEESPIQFECKVNQIVPLGNDGAAGRLVICEVIKMHFAETILDADHNVDPGKLSLLARGGKDFYYRASPDNYFTMEKLF